MIRSGEIWLGCWLGGEADVGPRGGALPDRDLPRSRSADSGASFEHSVQREAGAGIAGKGAGTKLGPHLSAWRSALGWFAQWRIASTDQVILAIEQSGGIPEKG